MECMRLFDGRSLLWRMKSQPGSFEHCSSICHEKECNQSGSDGRLDVETSIALSMVI